MSQAQTANGKLKENKSSNHPLADKMKDAMHDSVDTLATKAAKTEESVRQSAQSGSENFAAKQKELTNKWENSAVKQYATENPVATAGIAFAAGMLLTAFLKRK